jgi:hypothetical protein
VHKSEIQELGTKRDINWWDTKRRIDDERWHMLVETPQEMIYQDGVRLDAKVISQFLESQALNPTHVSSILYFTKNYI